MTIVEIVAMMGYFVVLVIVYLQTRVIREVGGEHKAWIFWALHGIIFYAALFGDRGDSIVNIGFFNNWSAILRLHGIITIIMVTFFQLMKMRLERGAHEH